MARELVHAVRRIWAFPGLHIGRITSTRPLSDFSGYDRGMPIDRYYIDRFLAAHASDIRGRVLEVGEPMYSHRFGGGRITCQDILHIDHSNPAATIVGDLSTPGLLAPDTFDCIVITQTLQYVFDTRTALAQIRRALRPGGVALITVPGLAPISEQPGGGVFFWRFTVASLTRLLSTAFGVGKVEMFEFGNIYAATHFLHGAAVQEVQMGKLEPLMHEYALVIAARAVAQRR